MKYAKPIHKYGIGVVKNKNCYSIPLNNTKDWRRIPHFVKSVTNFMPSIVYHAHMTSLIQLWCYEIDYIM